MMNLESFDRDFDKLFNDHKFDIAVVMSKSSTDSSLVISGYSSGVGYDAACRVISEWLKDNLPAIKDKVNQAIKKETEGEGPYLDLEPGQTLE